MFRWIALLALFAHYVSAATAPLREVNTEATLAGGLPMPAFYKGYIYWVGLSDGDRNQATIYTPDGHLAPILTMQDGAVESIAADTDGTLAIAWASKKIGGIDLRDPAGALLRTIETGRYRPTHIYFAADHSIWTLGWQRDATDPTQPDGADYMTVRKYLSNGQEAGAYLPRSLFPRGLEPGMQSWQESRITVAHDRVGLWTYSGKNSNQTEWVELDLNGNLTGRWRLDQFNYDTRVAFTTDGHVFIQSFDPKAKAHRLYTLDRASSAWQLVETSPNGWLDSADGDSLVFSDFANGPIQLRWYPHP